jgi:PhnB protein
MTDKATHIPEGFHTLTPYLTCGGVSALLSFVADAFGAVETFRMAREDGTIAHASVRIGDSMVEMAEPAGEWKEMPAGVHLYVADVEEAYRRAIAAGGRSLYEPRDMEYCDREGGVKDPSGNDWYIATHRRATPKGAEQKLGNPFASQGFRSVTPGLNVTGAAALLQFLEKSFGASIVDKKAGTNGTVGHATVQIGDSVLECSEAHGQWGPRPVAIHVYVPDVDRVYCAAIAAGATSLAEPKDQFYGERSGAAMDAWGNHWYIATHQETLTEAELRRRAAEQTQSAG